MASPRAPRIITPRLPGPPPPPRLPGTVPRPPVIRRFAAMPTGPRLLTQPGERIVGPGEPPTGFVEPTTSTEEWWCYWALAKVFADPVDPREPPFFGGRRGTWSYQSPFFGGRREIGGAVVDFVANGDFGAVGIRLQTERYHIFAGPRKHATDLLQRERLGARINVVDIFSQDFIEDPSGASIIKLIKAALGRIEAQNPVTAGTARRTRLGG